MSQIFGEITRLWHFHSGVWIHVVAFVEDGMWVLQGLEHDIAAQGRSMEEAVRRFGLAVEEEFEMRDGNLSEIEPCPQRFHDMWAALTKETKDG